MPVYMTSDEKSLKVFAAALVAFPHEDIGELWVKCGGTVLENCLELDELAVFSSDFTAGGPADYDERG